MRNRSALALAICLAAAVVLPGCARQQQGSSSSPSKKLRLAFVTNNASDFWTIARRGTEKADQELDNVEVEFRIAADGTAADQKRIVDDLLAKGINGMAISPVDPANQTQMINDAAKSILVITQDSDAPQSDRACYIGTDNRAAGRQAGELVKASLPQGGKIMAFDEEDDTLKGIREGYIEGTIVQQPYQFGYQSVKMMAQILGGDRSMIPATKQIFVPTRVIKKENVDDFVKEINQLRGRT